MPGAGEQDRESHRAGYIDLVFVFLIEFEALDCPENAIVGQYWRVDAGLEQGMECSWLRQDLLDGIGRSPIGSPPETKESTKG